MGLCESNFWQTYVFAQDLWNFEKKGHYIVRVLELLACNCIESAEADLMTLTASQQAAFPANIRQVGSFS